VTEPAPLVPPRLRAHLALVRHGETAWVAEDRFQGWQDPPLSELGRRQADLVAERLGRRDREALLPLPPAPPATVRHSPLSRARQTAVAIGSRLPGVPLVPSPALLEIGQGEWEGRLNAEVARTDGERLATWRRDPTLAHAPGGESLVDAAARVRTGLVELFAALSESGPGEPWAIVVGHSGTLRLALLSMLQVPYQRYWSFAFALCAITIVELADGRATLRAHNLADHLAPLVGDRAAAAEARGEKEGAL
jgi:broad specificity phosphatase PhoE